MENLPTKSKGLPKAFALCALAYILALGVAILVGYALGERHPVLIAFVADIPATLGLNCVALNQSDSCRQVHDKSSAQTQKPQVSQYFRPHLT